MEKNISLCRLGGLKHKTQSDKLDKKWVKSEKEITTLLSQGFSCSEDNSFIIPLILVNSSYVFTLAKLWFETLISHESSPGTGSHLIGPFYNM